MKGNLNRLLHALAGKLVTSEHAHSHLRDLAQERYKKPYRDLSDGEAKDLADYLRKEYPKMRSQLFGILHEGEQMITHEQLAFAKDLQRKLGWSDTYMSKLLRSRYDEEQLDLMPNWKAVRLISLMNRRFQRKKSKSQSERSA